MAVMMMHHLLSTRCTVLWVLLYSNRLSPFLAAELPATIWALQAGQMWEMLRDGQLLSRHLQLQQASDILQKALEPPPVVLEHRQQVGSQLSLVLPREYLL